MQGNELGLYFSFGPQTNEQQFKRIGVSLYSWILAGIPSKNIYLIANNTSARMLANMFPINYIDFLECLGNTDIPHDGYQDSPMLPALFKFIKDKHKYTCFMTSDMIVDTSYLDNIERVLNKYPDACINMKRWSLHHSIIEDNMIYASDNVPILYTNHMLIAHDRGTADRFMFDAPDDSTVDLSYGDTQIFKTELVKDKFVPNVVRGAVFDTQVINGLLIDTGADIYVLDHLIKMYHFWHDGKSAPEHKEYQHNKKILENLETNPYWKHILKTPTRNVKMTEVKNWSEIGL